MTAKTIKRLNQLNRDFYNQVTSSFSASRQSPWPGWSKLIKNLELKIKNNNPSITHHQLPTILDIASGNGRFYFFLKDQFPQARFQYIGADNNPKLLDLANQKKGQVPNKNRHQALKLKNIDIITTLLNNQTLDLPQADIITVFGFLHHVPSFDLRLKLLNQLKKLLKPNGLMIVSFWKFYEFDRLRSKIINPKQFFQLGLNLNPVGLEPNDFILGWQNKAQAFRYCHYFDDVEVVKLSQALNLRVIVSFRADGKEERVNQYLVWEKAN